MKNYFDFSALEKTVTRIGRITPITWHNVLPGDEFTITPKIKIDFAPMVGKIIGIFKAKIAYMFVDLPSIWLDAKRHIQTCDNTNFPYPYKTVDLKDIHPVGSLKIWPYLGVGEADEDDSNENISMLAPRAYQKIYFDKFNRLKYSGGQSPDSYYIKSGGEDNSTIDNLQLDFYGLDSQTDMMAYQFYGTEPSIPDGAFTLQDLATMIGKTKQQSMTAKYMYSPTEFIKKLFNITDAESREDNDTAKTIWEKEYYLPMNNVINTAVTATYPLGVAQSNINADIKGDTFTFKSDRHGILMAVVSIIPVLPDIKGTRPDMLAPGDGYYFYNPNYANIGNMPVLGKCLSSDRSLASTVFGYRPVFDMWRIPHPRLGGRMQTDYKELTLYRDLTALGVTVDQVVADEYDYLFTEYDVPNITIQLFGKVDLFRNVVKIFDPLNPSGVNIGG